MELSDKTLNNLVALASACLRGEKVTASPLEMAEVWGDVAAAIKYLNRDRTPPGQVICANPEVVGAGGRCLMPEPGV